MTTATFHASGLGQDAWGQSIHPGGYPFAQQYGQPFGTQASLPQQYAQSQFVPQQPFGQQLFWQQQPYGQQQPFGQQPVGQQQPYGQQQPFGQQQPVGQQQPYGQQILAVLPALIAQQAQQLYTIAQMCTQLAPGSGYQVGLPQAGQRPYLMGL